MRRKMAAPLLALVFVGCALAIGACGSDGGDDTKSGPGEADYPECKAVNWRKATPNQVACPGVSSCLCDAPAVCCFTLRHSGSKTLVDSSSCTALQDCATIAGACDGPEDCPSGQVCCAGGSSESGSLACKAPEDCFGADDFVVCHGDSDCASQPGTTCVAAAASGAFAGLIAACALE